MLVVRSICLIIVATTTNANPLGAKYLPPLRDAATTEHANSYSAPFSTLKFSTAPNVAGSSYINLESNLARFNSSKLETPIYETDSSYAASSNVLKSNTAPFGALKFSTAPNVAENINLKGNSAPFSSLKFSTAPNVADNINTLASLSPAYTNSAPFSSSKLETQIYEIDSGYAASSNVLKSTSAPNKFEKYFHNTHSTTSSPLKRYSATVSKEQQVKSYSAPSKSGAASARHTSILIPAAQTSYSASASTVTMAKLSNNYLPPLQNAAVSSSYGSYSAPFNSLEFDKTSTNETRNDYSATSGEFKINSAESVETTQHPFSNSASIKNYSAPVVKLSQYSIGATNIHTSFHHSPAYRTFSGPAYSKRTSIHTTIAPIISYTEKTSAHSIQHNVVAPSENFQLNYFSPSAAAAAAATTNQFYSDLETGPDLKTFKSSERGTIYAENGGYIYR